MRALDRDDQDDGRRQDFGGLGARAFELLRGAMSGEVVRRTSSALPELVIRESSAAPRPLPES
ncbi:hypothetical protein [Agromyces albus]|uniref:hypothetical protein n=1 Tax=Agromyces albus TaxID=205332 RepID=UPI002788FC6F|nr:hypothetical protein [Agromyces albus]MDQ0574352.1 DNA-binding LacI/PurR family transcriptional regulator [Agromyces albus]